MVEWVKKEITCIRLLFKLNKIKADYYDVLLKLGKLRELICTYGEIGSDIQRDIEKAEVQCRGCLKRFYSADECLKNREYRYINRQLLITMQQTKVFEELTQKVHGDIQDLAHILTMECSERRRECDQRRDMQKEQAGAV